MDEKISSDLSTRFNSAANLVENCNYHMELFHFSHDINAEYDIDNYKTKFQSTKKFIKEGIKENEEDIDTEIEDLLLGIKDADGNLVKYDNDDEYDLTEEQENHLLSEHCLEHYIKTLNISNLNYYDTTNDDDKLFFIDVTPFLVNENNVYDQHSVKFDTTNSLNINPCEGNKQFNLHNLTDEDNKNSDFSNEITQQIYFKGKEYNSETESHVLSYVDMKEGKYSFNSSEKKYAETISDLNDEEIHFSYANSNSGSLTNDALPEPIEESACLSSTNLLINSDTAENDIMVPNDELKGEEITEKREFELSKVLSSDSARKIYLDLLKDRAQFLLSSYNKYKNEFLRSPSRVIVEFKPGKSFKNTENILVHHSRITENKLLDDNINVSITDIQPLQNVVERANDDSKSHFYNLRENRINDSVKSSTDALQSTNIEEEFQEKIIQNGNDIKINHTDNNDGTSHFTDDKTACTTDGLFFNVSQDKTSRHITDALNLRNGSQIVIVEQQQNTDMEYLSNPADCTMSKQISNSEEDGSNLGKNISNEIYETLPRNKFTEIVNSSLFLGYEVMDFQSKNQASDIETCSSDKSTVSDIDETNVSHSELKFQKKAKKCKLKITKLSHSRRISALRHKNSNIVQTRRQKRSNTDVSFQTLLDLFNLNNKIVTHILSALLSDQFQTGACLTDIMKYLRREMALERATKLRQDIEKFLKAAVDAGFVQMKYRRYILTKEIKACGSRKTTKKIQARTNMNLRKRSRNDK